jgi:hypothetical protein
MEVRHLDQSKNKDALVFQGSKRRISMWRTDLVYPEGFYRFQQGQGSPVDVEMDRIDNAAALTFTIQRLSQEPVKWLGNIPGHDSH